MSMTKQEVLIELKKANQIDTAHRTPLWAEAFRLYNEAHPQAKKQMNCGACFTRVKNWLVS